MSYNLTGAGTGALAGASTGASIGSIIPGVGTGIGAGIGGLIGGIGGLFSGKKKKKKLSTFDPRQEKLNQFQFQGLIGQGPLADLYNYNAQGANDVFNQIVADPAYRNFKENLAPTITGQFRKQGLQNSSYVGDALGRTARDVQQGLDAQRAQYLYGEQKEAQAAKRNALENFQNRNTSYFDTANQGGFDINQILASITPEMIDQIRNYFQASKQVPRG